MPAMIRPKGKPQKIAYKILGVPDTLQSKATKKERKINKRLVFEETSRVR